jgi:hypothetical protein
MGADRGMTRWQLWYHHEPEPGVKDTIEFTFPAHVTEAEARAIADQLGERLGVSAPELVGIFPVEADEP